MDDKKFTILENHPADSRVKVSDVFQTLSSRMGTVGGNVPMVMEEQPLLLESTQEYATVQTNGIATTLMARMGTGGNNVPMVVEKSCTWDGKQINSTLTANNANGGQRMPDKDNFNAVIQGYIVRRLTPLECERLQGYPTIREVKCTEMTKDEYIAWNISEGNIIVDAENGKVYRTRGPGGIELDEPKEMTGSNVNGYLCVSIRNGNTKMSCRMHRIVWIAVHGIIPDGYVIDHINNDKKDNRIKNLQMLTPEQNSHKAKQDGLYLTGQDSPATKISDEVHDLIQWIYGNSEITMRQLSETFGISKSRVHQIIHDRGWTDIGEWVDSKGKKHKDSDSPRYKALGNSIALPFWQWLAERMVKQLKADGVDDPKMGSLFDGISGFPLCYARAGCKPMWSSEIEEFPIAVAKKHFGDEKTGEEGDYKKYLEKKSDFKLWEANDG